MLSQGWKHTREQMAASGFLSRCSASASSKRFSPIRLTKPGTSTPAGHAFWHGARTSSGQTPARHFLSRMCSTNSSRKWRMADSTGLGAVWPRPHSAVSLIVLPRSIRRSMSPSCPCPRRCGPGSPACAWCRSCRGCTCRTIRPGRTRGRIGICPPCRCPRPSRSGRPSP